MRGPKKGQHPTLPVHPSSVSAPLSDPPSPTRGEGKSYSSARAAFRQRQLRLVQRQKSHHTLHHLGPRKCSRQLCGAKPLGVLVLSIHSP